MTTAVFRADRHRRLAEIEHEHFWFIGRRGLVTRLARRFGALDGGVLVDVGCGTGLTLGTVAGPQTRAVGLDMQPGGLARPLEGPRRMLLIRGDAMSLPVADAVADVVLALDVLEHVDDRVTLDEIHRILRPGGVLVATVPSCPSLWSYRDEDAGHLRRYTSASVRRALHDSGLEVTLVTYYQFILFPVVVLARWLGRRWHRIRDAEEQLPPRLNNLLRRLALAESAALARGIAFPWGSSLVAVARRPT